jgi:hypothetical protein
MTPWDVLVELNRRGIPLERRPHGKPYASPFDRLTPQLRQDLRTYRHELHLAAGCFAGEPWPLKAWRSLTGKVWLDPSLLFLTLLYSV